MNTVIVVICLIVLFALLLLIMINHGSNSNERVNNKKPITYNDIVNAQKNWGNALVAISKAYEKNGIKGAAQVANQALDSAYGYNLGPVLFNPTLTSGKHVFRPTREGALAYFIGGNPNFPDKGFAIKGWRSVSTKPAAYFIDGDIAMWMGNVFLTDKNGKVTMVDKSWGYKRDKDGTLRIVLHHSSLPYEP